MFDPDHVLEIDIELDPGNWNRLCQEERTFDQIVNAICENRPLESPYTYYPAAIEIDGERVEPVAVRKKGLIGSESKDKPSLKVKFNEYVRGQRYSGLNRLTLNNCKQDTAFIKQCLGYQLFARAGVPAPRCNFAHVTVNGSDLGIYAHIESVKRDFLERHFPDGTGNLYEGTLSDFRPEISGTFQVKTQKSSPDTRDIEAIVDAFEMADDSAFLEQLERLIDLDAYLSFWVMEVMIAHWDGYACNRNNFYIYHNPDDDRFHFIPWGIDGTLAHPPPGFEPCPGPVYGNGMIANRLQKIPETRDRLEPRFRVLLDEIWDEKEILAEIDRMETLLSPYSVVYPAEVLQWNPDYPPRMDVEIDRVRDFVRTNGDAIWAFLAPGLPVYEEEPGGIPCASEIGRLDASFDTTWGTYGIEDPTGAGGGTFDLTLDGSTVEVVLVASTAGFDNNAPGRAFIQVFGLSPSAEGDLVYIAHVEIIDPELVAPGEEVPFDFTTASGGLLVFNLSTGVFEGVVGMFLTGSVVFQEGGIVDGAPVSGSLSTAIMEFEQ